MRRQQRTTDGEAAWNADTEDAAGKGACSPVAEGGGPVSAAPRPGYEREEEGAKGLSFGEALRRAARAKESG